MKTNFEIIFQSIYLLSVYYALGFLVNCVFHFLYRIILVWEEFKHLKTRYNNSYLAVLIDAFSFSNYVYITSLFCLLGICIKPPTDIIPTILNFSSIVCFAPTIFLLGKFFDLVSKYECQYLYTIVVWTVQYFFCYFVQFV